MRAYCTILFGVTPLLLDHNKFVVKSQSKMFSSKKAFEIVDGDSGQALATARDTTGFVSAMMGATTIQVVDTSNSATVFSVSRTGLFLKKDQVLDPQGQVIGRFKSKMFSLSGGFHIYDKDGKHIGEIQGKMLKAEYKIVTPEKVEMGSVSRTWGGMAKSLLSGSDSYGVQIAPDFAGDNTAKILILGATIAIESIFKKGKEASAVSSVGGAAE